MPNCIYVKDRKYILKEGLNLKRCSCSFENSEILIENKSLALNLSCQNDIYFNGKYIVRWKITKSGEIVEYLEDTVTPFKDYLDIEIRVKETSVIMPITNKLNKKLNKFLTNSL